jgi:hypothetical protein
MKLSPIAAVATKKSKLQPHARTQIQEEPSKHLESSSCIVIE